MYHFLSLFVVLALVAPFAGCDSQESLYELRKRLTAETDVALAEANKIEDPWKAFQQLDSSFKAIERQERCEYGNCAQVSLERERAVWAAQARYAGAAVARGEGHAMAYVFKNRHRDEVAPLFAKVAPLILAAATKASGTPADREALHIAGLLIAEGKHAMQDSRAAIAYLARAWAAGKPGAANDAAMHFLSLNDQRNAYLWSLRCTAPCERSDRVQLEQLQQSLQPEAARQAQASAANAAVIELDTRS